MGWCHSIRSISIGLLILFVQVLIAGEGAADWKVYVAPGLGISGASVETDGLVPGLPVSLTGNDDDSAPLVSLAVGLEIPMDELVPREWLLDIRLPDWPVRVEMEGAVLREYEFQTRASSEDFFTELKVKGSFFVNFFLDIPLVSIYKPVQYTFSLGRQPALRRWLEPASFYVGAGLGFAAIDIDATSNVINAKEDSIEFAWNAGMGINYELTPNVGVSVGYRYVGLGTQKIIADGPTTVGPLEYDPQLHEFRVGIRIRVFEFFSPWR